MIPTFDGTCPTLATGDITVLGQTVTLWVGDPTPGQHGPVFFYWHGTGGAPDEAQFGLGPALDDIVAAGGIVASFSTTTANGTNTANNVWYTGDYEMADIILACAVEQLDVDTRQIYTGGCSAGGLQAGVMVYKRSSYLAGAMPNSGGIISALGFFIDYSLEDPSHVPALITAHGGQGVDVVGGADFSVTSLDEATDIADLGGFVVDCDHGGDHCLAPAELIAAQWAFLKAHPFGVDPEPYAAGLPTSFPSYCAIIE